MLGNYDRLQAHMDRMRHRAHEPADREARIAKVPFDSLEPAALNAAAEEYESITGDVDTVALGAALERFWECRQAEVKAELDAEDREWRER